MWLSLIMGEETSIGSMRFICNRSDLFNRMKKRAPHLFFFSQYKWISQLMRRRLTNWQLRVGKKGLTLLLPTPSASTVGQKKKIKKQKLKMS